MEIDTNQIQFILDKLQVLNEDYTQLAVDVGVLKSQVGQILQYQQMIFGAILAIVVFVVGRAIYKRLNNKK